jgi:hypothetical protein
MDRGYVAFVETEAVGVRRKTRPALDLAVRWPAEPGAGPCVLDAPVSNSGRLAAMTGAGNPAWSAEVVPDPDKILIQPGKLVVSADFAIFDRCGRRVNLAKMLVGAGVPTAFVVDLK